MMQRECQRALEQISLCARHAERMNSEPLTYVQKSHHATEAERKRCWGRSKEQCNNDDSEEAKNCSWRDSTNRARLSHNIDQKDGLCENVNDVITYHGGSTFSFLNNSEKWRLLDIALSDGQPSAHFWEKVGAETKTLVIVFPPYVTTNDPRIQYNFKCNRIYHELHCHDVATVAGYYKMFELIKDGLYETLDRHYVDGMNLQVTGFSLGGAHARYFAFELVNNTYRYNFNELSGVTFGEVVSGDSRWKEWWYEKQQSDVVFWRSFVLGEKFESIGEKIFLDPVTVLPHNEIDMSKRQNSFSFLPEQVIVVSKSQTPHSKMKLISDELLETYDDSEWCVCGFLRNEWLANGNAKYVEQEDYHLFDKTCKNDLGKTATSMKRRLHVLRKYIVEFKKLPTTREEMFMRW